MTTRILLLEDDPAIAGTVAFALQREGFEVDHVLLLGAARAAAAHALPSLAILDVGLPDGSGLDLCRAWRQSGDPALRALPVLMLTARAEELDRVVGLELGADDYLTKPFSPRELALRVRSVLRRAPSSAGILSLDIHVGELTVSTASRSVTIKDQPVSLTNREFDLLLFFLTHADTVFSREELLKLVWRWDFGDLSTVTVHVKRLRSKLGEHHRVQTVWGRGYLWSGHARE